MCKVPARGAWLPTKRRRPAREYQQMTLRDVQPQTAEDQLASAPASAGGTRDLAAERRSAEAARVEAARSGAATWQAPAGQPRGTSVRAVKGGLPSLGKRR